MHLRSSKLLRPGLSRDTAFYTIPGVSMHRDSLPHASTLNRHNPTHYHSGSPPLNPITHRLEPTRSRTPFLHALALFIRPPATRTVSISVGPLRLSLGSSSELVPRLLHVITKNHIKKLTRYESHSSHHHPRPSPNHSCHAPVTTSANACIVCTGSNTPTPCFYSALVATFEGHI